MEYKETRRIFRVGGKTGSLVITLPKLWLSANKLQRGDTVKVCFDNYPFLKIEVDSEDKHANKS